MLPETNAEAGVQPGGQETSQESVTPKKPEQPSKETVTADAKKPEEAPDLPTEEEEDPSKKPFHEHV